MGAVIVVEIVAAVLILHVYHGDVEKEVEAFMNSTIERDYKPDNPTAVTVLWDHMMTQLECCEYRVTQTLPARCLPPAAPLPTSPVQILRPRPRFHRWSPAASLFSWQALSLRWQPPWLLWLSSSWLAHCLLVVWQEWLPLRRGSGMSSVITDREEEW